MAHLLLSVEVMFQYSCFLVCSIVTALSEVYLVFQSTMIPAILQRDPSYVVNILLT